MTGNIARGLSTDQARVFGAKTEGIIPSKDLKQLFSYLLRVPFLKISIPGN